MKRSTIIWIIILCVLSIDQSSKILVKTMFQYGESMKILGMDWAQIHFVENNGMAFGISLGGNTGKLLLSVFRLIAVGFLIYLIKALLLEKTDFLLTIGFSLILAGAIGNILDSAFYGLIFSGSSPHSGPATLFPADGGYAPFLFGRVVDMFYFPIYNGYFPEWVPFWGGESVQFFRPVFNVADVSITIGVILIILFLFGILGNEKDTSILQPQSN